MRIQSTDGDTDNSSRLMSQTFDRLRLVAQRPSGLSRLHLVLQPCGCSPQSPRGFPLRYTTYELVAGSSGVKPCDLRADAAIPRQPQSQPFQINDSWIHPDIAKEAPQIREQDPAPGAWLYHIERAGHWPLQWIEYHRARQVTREEAAELEIPTSMWVLEIVRVGRSGKSLKPVEVTSYVIPADRIETVQVLERDESAKDPWPD